jgi:hypothetical protein
VPVSPKSKPGDQQIKLRQKNLCRQNDEGKTMISFHIILAVGFRVKAFLYQPLG